MWTIVGLVLLAGAIGGLVNGMISSEGFTLPRMELSSGGQRLFRPGFLGNVLAGAVAAVVSWGLYGTTSGSVISGAIPPNQPAPFLSVAAFVGAVLIGVGGARWLSDQVDKKLLRETAAEAAKKGASPEASFRLALAKPAEALEIARRMK